MTNEIQTEDWFCGRCFNEGPVVEIPDTGKGLCLNCIDLLASVFHKTTGPLDWPIVESSWCDMCGKGPLPVVFAVMLVTDEENIPIELCEPCLNRMRGALCQ